MSYTTVCYSLIVTLETTLYSISHDLFNFFFFRISASPPLPQPDVYKHSPDINDLCTVNGSTVCY